MFPCKLSASRGGAHILDVRTHTPILDSLILLVHAQSKAAAPPPSLSELKEYSSKLAEAVAGEEARVEHEARVGAMFAVAEQTPSRARRLRGMVQVSRGFGGSEDGADVSITVSEGASCMQGVLRCAHDVCVAARPGNAFASDHWNASPPFLVT